MKNLVLASLICGVAAQLGTGCVIVDDDNNPPPPPPPPDAAPPDAPPPGPGEFEVTWTLLGGEAQEEVDCPPADLDIIITADPNPDPTVTGDEDIYLYDCTAGVGFADMLPPGNYDVFVQLVQADGTLVALSDTEEAVPLDFEQVVPLNFTFPVDHARFALSWVIFDGDTQVTCEEAGADEVSLLLTVVGTADGTDFPFTCVDGDGVTDKMPLADYVGSVSLLDNDAAIVVEPAENISLDFGNQFNDLGTFMFDL